MYRQGDVLVESVETIGDGQQVSERLLVRGEGRNHGHFIQGCGVEIFRMTEHAATDGGGLVTHFLKLDQECTLEHLLIDSAVWTGEHAPITIPPGTYRVIRQREYNPYLKAIRAVKD